MLGTSTSACDRIREAGFILPFQGEKKKAKGQNIWNNDFQVTGHQVMQGWEKKKATKR